MKHIKKLIAAIGLAGIVSQASAQVGATAFVSRESQSSSPNAYVEVDHATQLPGVYVSGFIDLYTEGGYFGKTSFDRTVGNGLGVRVQAIHANEALTQTGAGISFSPQTPEGTFLVLRYLPIWVDTDGNVEDKQILGYFVSVDFSKDITASSFGEIDVAGSPNFVYGEAEITKKLTDTVSVGANLQLNGKGGMTPEVVPRVAIRYRF